MIGKRFNLLLCRGTSENISVRSTSCLVVGTFPSKTVSTWLSMRPVCPLISRRRSFVLYRHSTRPILETSTKPFITFKSMYVLSLLLTSAYPVLRSESFRRGLFVPEACPNHTRLVLCSRRPAAGASLLRPAGASSHQLRESCRESGGKASTEGKCGVRDGVSCSEGGRECASARVG